MTARDVKKTGIIRLHSMFTPCAHSFALLAISLAACSGNTALRASGSDAAVADAGGRADTTQPSGCRSGATPLATRVLASGGFTGVAIVSNEVIVTGDGQVQKIPLDGGPPSTLASMSEAYGLLVVAGNAYFMAEVPPMGLYAVPLSGGEPTRVLDTWFEIDRSTADSDAIYFPAIGGGVTRFSVADRLHTTLALPVALMINALAVLDGIVYVAAQDLSSMSATNSVILRLDADGTPTTLAANIGHPWNLVADAGGLTWIQDGPTGDFSVSPRVVRAGLDGRDVRTLVEHSARSIVAAGDMLYVSWDGISSVPLAGGAEVTLVPSLKAPGMLAVAGGNAAWVDPDPSSKAKSDPTVPMLETACW